MRISIAARALAPLVLLALSTPALIATLVLIGVDSEVVLLAAGLWSVGQMVLVVTWVRRRAEQAEATGRRKEERLHELRATVSGIGMTHRLLHERADELPTPTRMRLEGLYESELSRLQRLVDEEAPTHDEVQTLDVESLVAPLVESLRLRGVAVTWAGGSARAAGRSDEFVEIVHNLLENAVRHAGGADVSVTISTAGDEVRVDVSDGGPGIPTTLRPRLFERGVRRDGSPGHGLGLHIARRLAREMGGDLLIHPASGSRGAGFTLMLPAAAAEGAPCLAHTE